MTIIRNKKIKIVLNQEDSDGSFKKVMNNFFRITILMLQCNIVHHLHILPFLV